MYTHRRLVTLFALSLAAGLVATAQAPVGLKSPDGALELSIATVGGAPAMVQEAGGQLAYRVTFRGKPVVDWSNLGLAIQGAPVLGSAVRVESSRTSTNDSSWNSIAGKANPIRDHYNAVTVETVETAPNGRRLAIEARAYDDGVAFRYA
ncbi:MAG: glycoside hydrolase family 97 N-terminal domain-containing protein, partial [Bryobacteraceae bacterium]